MSIILVRLSKLSCLSLQSVIDLEVLLILHFFSTDYFLHHDPSEILKLLRESTPSDLNDSNGGEESVRVSSLALFHQLSTSTLWDDDTIATDVVQSFQRLLPIEDIRCDVENVISVILRKTVDSVASLEFMAPLLVELLHYEQKSSCFLEFIDVACDLLPDSFPALSSFLLSALEHSSSEVLLEKLPLILRKAPLSSYSTSLEYALFLVSLNIPSLVHTQNTILSTLDVSSVPGHLWQLLVIACSRGFVSTQDILNVLNGNSLDSESRAKLAFSLLQKRLLKMKEIGPCVSSLFSSDSTLVQSLIVQIYFENWIQQGEIESIQYFQLLPCFLAVLRHDAQQTQIVLQSLCQVFSLPELIDFDSILISLGEVMNLQGPLYTIENHCLALRAVALYLEKRKWGGDIPFWKQQLECICSLAKNSRGQNTEYCWSVVVRNLLSICSNCNYLGARKKEIQGSIQKYFSV